MPSINSAKRHRRLLPRIAATFETRDGQQPTDQFVQAIGFEIDAVERAVSFRAGALPRQRSSYVKTSQRRAEFVGNVIQQSGLRFHRFFKALRHGVEIAHQLRHFVTPSRGKAAGSRGEISCSQPPCGGSKANHRGGQVSRQQIANKPGRDNPDQDAQPGNTARTEGAGRRQESTRVYRWPLPATNTCRRNGLGIRRCQKSRAGGVTPLARDSAHRGRSRPEMFLPLFTQKIGPNVQRLANFVEVAPGGGFAALFIILDSLGKHAGLLSVPGG